MRHPKHCVYYSKSPSKASAGVKFSDLSVYVQEKHVLFVKSPGKKQEWCEV